ncbi:MAG: 16S rRNA (cytidine(1402)-2'-O)-methyltransferase [Pygmaiobacter massiliensis]|jgi:16S rRNA (cytidine1402-2'-O)-methyltransferase|nr:16S rRNA (cytidine(1402)-2'-O)-methyltransferase [Pygmaiobacter massiliensis]
MAGTLYIVATPIGNLQDMTARAAQTFAAADFIAAEDTRVTLKLLNHLGLKKPMVSYYEHNLKERGEIILRRIEAGESCAMCSDAGMPAVSDPGELLVKDALMRGIRVVPIPAASAAVTALAVSGQPTGRWCFEGFLPMNRRQRAERLEELCQERRTMIFYEAPHKLPATLCDLAKTFGEERSVTVCRELTKLHEEIWKTTLGTAQAHYAQNAPKGEFVLVVEGAQPAAGPSLTLEQAVQLACKLMEEGLAPSAACKQAAAATGFAKSEIYRLAGRTKKEEEA